MEDVNPRTKLRALREVVIENKQDQYIAWTYPSGTTYKESETRSDYDVRERGDVRTKRRTKKREEET